MFQNPNVYIPPYYGGMEESILLQDSKISFDNTPYQVNVMELKPFKRCISRDSEHSQNQLTTIDDELIGHSSYSSPQTYKCYKCFDQKNKYETHHYQHKCSECSGTSYINQSHPLVNLLEELLRKKLPNLFNKHDETTKKNDKKQTLEFQYGCQDVIKEESFSYQEELTPICRSCNKDCFSNNDRFCQKCCDFFICQNCYNRKNYHHQHELGIKGKDQIKHLSHQRMKVYENNKGLQTINSDQILQQDEIDLRCHNCLSKVEGYYEACLTCQKGGIQYVICANCSEKQLYYHNSNHELGLKTMSHASQLLRLQSRQSDTSSIQNKRDSLNYRLTQSQQISESSYSQHQIQLQSVINIRQDQISSNEQKSMGDESPLRNGCILKNIVYETSNANFQLLNSSDQISQFLSLQITKKLSNSSRLDGEVPKIEQKPKQKMLRSSTINIDMSCSLEYPNNNQIFGPIQETKQEDCYTPTFDLVPVFPSKQDQSLKPRCNPQDEYVFNDYQCDICHILPIKNRRYHCKDCQNYDICQSCYLFQAKNHQHKDYEEIDGHQIIKQQRESLIRTNQLKNTQRQSIKNSHIGKKDYQ